MSEHEWRHQRYILAWGVIALLVVIGVSIAFSAIFFIPRPAPGAYYPFFPFFPFGGFFALFSIFAIFWLVRWFFWPWRWHYPRRYWRYRDESYYIIRERYAKGEITKEQFEQMMRDLEQHLSFESQRVPVVPFFNGTRLFGTMQTLEVAEGSFSC